MGIEDTKALADTTACSRKHATADKQHTSRANTIAFMAMVDVPPRLHAKVAMDQVWHRHRKPLKELSDHNMRAITCWATPVLGMGLPT